ncbi:MAG: carbohydrate kinase [Paracoccaceae bacterium]
MILCCGEALIDLLPGENDTPLPLVGGSVLNTAVALGRLGAEVGLLTGLSSDAYGQQIEAHLDASHVSSAHCIRSDRPTTLAVVTLVDGQAQYRFEDEGSALRMIGVPDLPALPDTVQTMVFGGISLIPTPIADTLAHLCVNRPDDVICMLDANVRPGFVNDPKTYRARLQRMLAATDIIKVSDEDLEWLVPDTGSVQDAIAQLLDAGPSVVLFTEGAKGASAIRAGQDPVFVASRSVDVVDTVGAGDTFNAGVLHSLKVQGKLKKSELKSAPADVWRAALDFASGAAAITVSRAGANPPWANELES